MACRQALVNQEEWEEFLQNAGIPKTEATQYAKAINDNRIQNPTDLTKDILRELKISIIGDQIAILKYTKSMETTGTTETSTASETKVAPKPFKPQINLPKASSEMTSAEFRKFRTDWSVYRRITQIQEDQVAPQLYTACEESVQNHIINTTSEFFTMTEEQCLSTIERIVTRQANPAVHRLSFSNLTQSENEAIKSYLVRLRSAAKDCVFQCPSCKVDLAEVHIKDQLIRGIANTALQTDILAKTSSLQSLEAIVKHAEAFESAIQDQSSLTSTHSAEAMRIQSDYKRSKNAASRKNYQTPTEVPKNYQGYKTTKTQAYPCRGCGSHSHSSHSERQKHCPAWEVKCSKCGIMGHYAKVCFRNKPSHSVRELRNQDKDDSKPDQYLMSHLELIGDTYTSVSSITIHEIPAQITLPGKSPIDTHIFPDSGASICLAGTHHLDILNIKEKDLIQCKRKVMAVGGSILTCKGYINVKFTIEHRDTHQPLYICDHVDRIYFSRQGCTEVNILHPKFPYPMEQNENATMAEVNTQKDQAPKNNTNQRSRTPPCPLTEENIPKLKEHLLKEFSSVFTRATPFPAMHCQPAHIHLKPDAIPHAVHTPIPVPIHWKDEVKADLDRDVENGIIEPVPIGDPAIWCSPMIIVGKNDGRLRRTVDFQKLNSQCVRETHHTESPFKLASQIPPGKKKTVLDATDGYHAIPLDDESKPLTTFITEWGRYRYKRLPQGFIASGDAYTRRYDAIIQNIKNKVKCVDDALLWHDDVAAAYYETFDYLVLCEKNNITLNGPKFQFAVDDADFAGLEITLEGIRPPNKLLTAIRDFPTPKDLTGARSWFGIVNQISWAYANAAVMQPFRDLVKPKSKFYWDSTLQKLFEDSKIKLISCATEGIRSFDKSRNTCLQPDWCRDGIGYLLLQQYCSCTSNKIPVCCKDGWKLALAGSRFTKGAELNYSPTEGEALAVAWSLEHAKMFVLGCEKLVVSTDHKPLLGILQNRSLPTITNPRILKIKERTLPFDFRPHYNPGKWHRGPDALSRYPVLALFSAGEDSSSSPTNINHQSDARIEYIANPSDPSLVNIADIEKSAAEDPAYRSLLANVVSGFPKTKDQLDPSVKQFWNIKDRLSFEKDLVMLENRIVIPLKHQSTILNNLHSAHQGVNSMLRRASQSVYWPNIETAIRNKRYGCKICNERSPSQQKETYSKTQPPQYPFQEICLDYFQEGHFHYLSVVDRFTCWIIIYHFPRQMSSTMIAKCRDIFTCYGVSETVDTDGGPQFSSEEFKTFMKDWGINHRVSSVDYPQSNGRAELAVKTAKRIILENTNPDGSLNNNRAAQAILQYRNTPIKEIGLSPAQMLLHRQLRDGIPTNPKLLKPHKEWIITAEERERAYASRDDSISRNYDLHAKDLKPLQMQTQVRVQERGRWLKTGKIVECLPNRQYRIRMDGSGRLTLRNRRFIKEDTTQKESVAPAPLISPLDTQSSQEQTKRNDEILPTTQIQERLKDPEVETNTGDQLPPNQNQNRQVKRLQDFNKRGLGESPGRPNRRLRSGKDF